jgi:hypothetical protein
MSVSIDRIDSLLSPLLDRCDVIHQICCGAVGLGLIVCFDLKAPIRLMHRFEPDRLRHAFGPQSVHGSPVSICCRSCRIGHPTLGRRFLFACFPSRRPDVWSDDEA